MESVDNRIAISAAVHTQISPFDLTNIHDNRNQIKILALDCFDITPKLTN